MRKWSGVGLDHGPQVPFQGMRRSINGERHTIPRAIAEAAYVEYAKQNGSNQSFDRLHERGGFGAFEMIGLLADALAVPTEYPTRSALSGRAETPEGRG